MTRPRILAASLLFACGWPSSFRAAEAPTLDLTRLLDDYAAGRFDQSVRAVKQGGDAQATLLRTQWRGDGRLWIDSGDHATKAQRLLAAASFALETEHLRAERGAWATPMAGVCAPDPRNPEAKSPAGFCVMEWAWSLLVERGVQDEAERAWVLAAAALLGGVRDFRFLFRPAPGATTPARGMLAEAVVRHPGDSAIRLERAIAMAARFSITTDGGGQAPPAITIISAGRGVLTPPARIRADASADVVAEFSVLAEDPVVGAEARLRLGYVLWVTGDTKRARTELAAAADAARNADLRYLAMFVRGWIALTSNTPAEAIPDFEAALSARPNSQSAVLALASLELQRGEAGKAHNLAQSSLAARPDDADPWRLFLYGHYPSLPALTIDLRRKVRP